MMTPVVSVLSATTKADFRANLITDDELHDLFPEPKHNVDQGTVCLSCLFDPETVC